jgi:hypothetical protein
MDLPKTTLLSPPHASEVLVLERVLLRLGELNAVLSSGVGPIRSAIEGRGLISAITAILAAVHQARGEEQPVRPLDLYGALYGVSFEDGCAWALSNRARHLALRLDLLLQRGRNARLGDWLGLPLALTPALPPADEATGIPRLYRAFELMRLAALQSRRQVECWGALPFALADTGLTPLPVPALTLTHQRMRLERFDPVVLRRQLLDQLDQRLFEVLGLAQRLARSHALMLDQLAPCPKAASLRRLADLLLKLPLVSPALLSRLLELDISSAGRLCTRAAEVGLVQLIGSRSSWKVYGARLVQDCYGYTLDAPVVHAPPARQMTSSVQSLAAEVDALLAEMDRRDS